MANQIFPTIGHPIMIGRVCRQTRHLKAGDEPLGDLFQHFKSQLPRFDQVMRQTRKSTRRIRTKIDRVSERQDRQTME